jgi:hypothetical protein
MKNTIQNLDELKFGKKITKRGYGNFPYLLYKSSPATFTQIPINLNKPNDIEAYPGTHINNIPEKQLEAYKNQNDSELYQILLERTQWVKEKIEYTTQKPCRICLVESPNKGYYFEGDEIKPSDDIPSGGTLLCLEGRILGLNTRHYI